MGRKPRCSPLLHTTLVMPTAGVRTERRIYSNSTLEVLQEEKLFCSLYKHGSPIAELRPPQLLGENNSLTAHDVLRNN